MGIVRLRGIFDSVNCTHVRISITCTASVIGLFDGADCRHDKNIRKCELRAWCIIRVCELPVW
jgi:hypothetical protein